MGQQHRCALGTSRYLHQASFVRPNREKGCLRSVARRRKIGRRVSLSKQKLLDLVKEAWFG